MMISSGALVKHKEHCHGDEEEKITLDMPDRMACQILEMQDSDLKTLLGKMHCYLIEVAMKVRSRSDWARSSSNPVEDRHHYTE